MDEQRFNRSKPGASDVTGEQDRTHHAIRAARELSHCATSLASEAANLTRALEPYHSAQASIAASKSSLDSALASFAIDDMAAGESPSLEAILERADASVEAALSAIQAAKRAIADARVNAARRGGASSAMG
jgi:hypothetical protein